MSNILKSIIPYIIVAIVTYFFAVNKTQTKYEKIFADQKQQITNLEAKEKQIETVVVTEYKDRIQYITKNKIQTVDVIKEVMVNDKETTNACVFGDGFVSLFNNSASGEAVSSPTRRFKDAANGVTTTQE